MIFSFLKLNLFVDNQESWADCATYGEDNQHNKWSRLAKSGCNWWKNCHKSTNNVATTVASGQKNSWEKLWINQIGNIENQNNSKVCKQNTNWRQNIYSWWFVLSSTSCRNQYAHSGSSNCYHHTKKCKCILQFHHSWNIYTYCTGQELCTFRRKNHIVNVSNLNLGNVEWNQEERKAAKGPNKYHDGKISYVNFILPKFFVSTFKFVLLCSSFHVFVKTRWFYIVFDINLSFNI